MPYSATKSPVQNRCNKIYGKATESFSSPHPEPYSSAVPDAGSSAKIPNKNPICAGALPSPARFLWVKMKTHIWIRQFHCTLTRSRKAVSEFPHRPKKYALENTFPEINSYTIPSSICDGQQTEQMSPHPPIDNPSESARQRSSKHQRLFSVFRSYCVTAFLHKKSIRLFLEFDAALLINEFLKFF